MLRATHVASVSRQDCRALFAKLSDVEHQLEPCDDGRRAAVRLKRDSNTVPKCPAAAGRGEHQASRGPWVVGGDVGRWGPCGLAHTRAMRGAHAGDAWRGGQGAGWSTRGCSPRGRAGSVWLGPHAAAPLLTRAFSIPSRARACPDCRGGEAKHAGRVDGGGREGEGGPRRKGPRRRRRSARLDGDDEGGEAERARRTATRGR